MDRSDSTLKNAVDSHTYSINSAEVGSVMYWLGLLNVRGRSFLTQFHGMCLSVFQFTVSSGSVYQFYIVGAQSMFAF